MLAVEVVAAVVGWLVACGDMADAGGVGGFRTGDHLLVAERQGAVVGHGENPVDIAFVTLADMTTHFQIVSVVVVSGEIYFIGTWFDGRRSLVVI